MTADLPNELIELLEKIVLDNSVFSEHRYVVRGVHPLALYIQSLILACQFGEGTKRQRLENVV